LNYGLIELGMLVRHAKGIGKVYAISFPAHTKEVFVDVECPDGKKCTWNTKEVQPVTINNGWSS
jgi:hypothetical protein